MTKIISYILTVRKSSNLTNLYVQKGKLHFWGVHCEPSAWQASKFSIVLPVTSIYLDVSIESIEVSLNSSDLIKLIELIWKKQW